VGIIVELHFYVNASVLLDSDILKGAVSSSGYTVSNDSGCRGRRIRRDVGGFRYGLMLPRHSPDEE
jgi:hypothetical protein